MDTNQNLKKVFTKRLLIYFTKKLKKVLSITIIKDIVGKENTVFTAKGDFYSRDWTGQYQSSPLVVVKPSSTLEVSKVVKACYQHKVPIVPISGNTGLSGGTSANNSIVISLERLNKIKDIKWFN